MRRAHVALVSPLIPQNVGHIGRTCAGLGATLHLIHPFSFSVDDASVRRAGLDYWPSIDVRVHESWCGFEQDHLADSPQCFIFSTRLRYGSVSLFDFAFPTQGDDVTLIFGSEHAGVRDLPSEFLDKTPKLFLPMSENIRSFNLSNTAAVGLFELHRQWHSTLPPGEGHSDHRRR
uniref:tRNA/rRNA methyltransferase SpoU type domain-containing protein n=1 Tax=Rhizochromulina marina TaxID=1034831 RepID=A0A7S2WFM3_9STRA|mmetsp:Transcript_23115/g.67351  ORF Transcript_23115/g.67351 Transcript_23115/m.67351 type:complete len:175 (+) Transcript_23115:108-632(+)